MITFDMGSNSEPTEKQGYTHIAEHLLLSGTRNYSKAQLMEKFHRAFDHIEATTSREQVKIFATFDIADFDEVVDTLQEMIFHWECSQKQWTQEKQWLENEMKEYDVSPECNKQQSLINLLPLPQHPIMGTVEALHALEHAQLKDIQEYWKQRIATAQAYVTFLGPFTRAHTTIISTIFTTEQKNAALTHAPTTAALQHNQRTVAIVIAGLPHAYHLLWDRILYFRCKDHPDGYLNTYTVFHDVSALSLYHSDALRVEGAQKILTSRVTKTEFDYVKDIFLKFLRGTLDCIDPINSLHWFAGFQMYAYAPWNTSDPAFIYQQFDKLSYAEFVQYTDIVIASLKEK